MRPRRKQEQGHVGKANLCFSILNALSVSAELQATALMQRLSYLTETVLINKITRNRIVLLSFKDQS